MEFPKYIVEQTFLQIIQKSSKKRMASGKLVLNGRCPICGEGKSKTKTRFYLYEKGGKFNVRCHNCEYGKSFAGFLRTHFLSTYEGLRSQVIQKVSDGSIFFTKPSEEKQLEKTLPSLRLDKFFKFYFNKCCIKLNDAQIKPNKEKYRQYCIAIMKKRGLPESIYNNYYACFSGKFKWRIIIPFINDEGLYYNFQARDVHPKPDEYRSNTKYLFAAFDKIIIPDDKIYKQYIVDEDKTVYICEGIIDSEFVNNSVALCGAEIGGEKTQILKRFDKKVWCIDFPWSDKKGYEVIIKLLEMGETCFIPPIEHKDCKDLNDLAKKLGKTVLTEDYIQSHLHKGSAALMKIKLQAAALQVNWMVYPKDKNKKDTKNGPKSSDE